MIFNVSEHEGKQDWQHGMLRPEPFVPEFKKRRRETEEAFMNRVDCETQAVIHRSQFEDKYQVICVMLFKVQFLWCIGCSK